MLSLGGSVYQTNTRTLHAGFRDPDDPYSEVDDTALHRFFTQVEEFNKQHGQTIYFNRMPITVESLYAHVTEAVHERDLRFVLIDQLELFLDEEHDGESERVSNAVQRLKQMARDFDIIVLALCQLNRNVDHQDDHLPTRTDLRMSGRLVQDADMIWFINRPILWEPTNTDPSFANYAQPIVDKARDSVASRQIINLYFSGNFAAFAQWPTHLPLPEMLSVDNQALP